MKRISLKLSNGNDWLVEAIEEEREIKKRKSFNNTVEGILVEYFKAKLPPESASVCTDCDGKGGFYYTTGMTGVDVCHTCNGEGQIAPKT